MDPLKHTWHKAPRSARRIIVFVAGIACIVAGIFMLVLPGPGWATIFLGLAILASEFEQARKIKVGVTDRYRHIIGKRRKSPKR